MSRSEIRVTINRPLSEVFATYTQPDTWRWTGLSNVHWIQGKPWEVGSRLHIEPDNAFGVVCDQVLTRFQVDSHVSFISHFGGITMQSDVSFRAVSDNATEIYSHLGLTGTFSRIAGFPFKSAIENGAKQFFEDMKLHCEGQATATDPRPEPGNAEVAGVKDVDVKEEQNEEGEP